MLKDNFKDEIPQSGKRKYGIRDNLGNYIYRDVEIVRTNGNTQDGDRYGAAEVNEERSAINQLTNPNLLINGDFQIWQRGTSFSGSKVKTYVADRWWYYNVDGVISKVSDGLQTNCAIHQNLESKLCKGKKYTISYSKNGVMFKRVITAQIYDSDYIENIKYFLNSNGYEEIAIRVDTTCIINWVKLELGEFATPLVSRPYAEEFLMCQRYYFSGDIPAPIMYEYGNNPYQYMVRINYSEMRDKPTVKSNMCVYHDSSGNSVEKSATVLEVARTAIKLRTPDGVRKNNYCFGIGVRIVLDAEIY